MLEGVVGVCGHVGRKSVCVLVGSTSATVTSPGERRAFRSGRLKSLEVKPACTYIFGGYEVFGD